MDEKLVRSRQKSPLETMASGIAHELNNILYPILIYADLLLTKAEVGSEDYSDLGEIIECAHRAENLIAKIRTYSGHIESSKEIADLVAITSEAMKSIRASIPETITIEEQICSATMPVFCDASQVSQVLTHLCTDAVAAIEGVG